ncbi:hypothetical protein PHLCEN_2v5934 [Hermanssonia centrifuga]|uniref:Uncharacterized protein n=1 Tax=Hermanssonia centrifuga TaxID=98765 RepID=A0A2R6P0Y2_9APHY|nr:hypothetical protein PHLCEN_2v5934 [Hermanssonia centrifuga]
MHFLKTLAVLPVLLASHAFASPLEKRVTVTQTGAIIAPVDGSSITPGTPFDFEYGDGWGDGCYPGFTSINVWLVDHEPTGSDLNSTYQFPDGDYLYYFGNFLIRNFDDLPPMSTPPPPSTLTLPEPLDSSYDDTEVYIAVVEELTSCVPTGYTKWGLESNNLQYSV